MKKKRPPILAAFLLAALLAGVAIFNARNQTPPGVFDPEAEERAASREALQAPAPPSEKIQTGDSMRAALGKKSDVGRAPAEPGRSGTQVPDEPTVAVPEDPTAKGTRPDANRGRDPNRVSSQWYSEESAKSR